MKIYSRQSETATNDEKPKEAIDEEREEEVEASEESTKVEKKVVDNIVDLTPDLLQFELREIKIILLKLTFSCSLPYRLPPQ